MKKQSQRGLLKAILDNIPEPAWLKDLQGRFLACNEPLATLFGRKVEDILGKTLFETLSADAERLAREDKEVIATGKPIHVERQLSDALGQRRWFDTIKSPVFNERGEVTGTLGISRETTERRQTDEALRVSEDRFRSVWEHSIDGMRLTDREGRILAVNEAFCRLVRLPREKLIGEVFAVAYEGHGSEEDIEVYRRRFEAGTIAPRLTAHLRLWNSEELDVEISSSFVESGRQSKTLLSIFRDVAERKQLEQALRESSQFNQQIVASAQEGIVVYDRDLKYQVWNPFMEQMTGFPASQVLGKHPAEVFPFLQEAGILTSIKQAVAGEPTRRIDFHFEIPQTGKSGWMFQTDAPLRNPAGEIIGVIGIVHDITERKNSDRRIAAFSNLGQQLSAAKSAKEAGEIIIDVADQLLGWDACTLDLYSPELDRVYHVLNRDTINGQRVECAPVGHDAPPSPRVRRTIETRGQLLLKDELASMSPDAVPFGDTARPSAAAMFVPIRDGSKVTGILSIHSYTPRAYDERGLATLQSLADHCGGALDRIRTHEALRQEQTLMLALMENLPARVYFKDAASRFLRVNPAIAKLFGLSDPAQAVGKSDADFFSAEHARQALADEQEIIRTGQPLLDIEEKETWPDGTGSWVLTSKLPLRDGAGRIIGTCGISSDITERKRAELRIAAFSNLGEKLSAAKTAREAAEIIVEVADQLLGWDACNFALYSPAEKLIHHVLNRDTVDGRRIESTPAYNDSPPSPLASRAIVEGGQLILKEDPGRMQPGGVPFGNTSRPSASLLFVPVSNGTDVIGVLSIQSYTSRAYDQHSLDTLQGLADHCGGALDRIRAEEAQAHLTQQLESRERRLTAFFSGATAGLMLVDKDLRFLQINDTLAAINGLPAKEHIGRTVREVLPRLAAVLEPLYNRVLTTGKPLLDIEVTGETPGRPGLQRHWAASYFPVIGTEGTAEGVGGIVVELTERKALEQQLRQSQKMEAIGQLAGGVAHDFNNMLAVIRGNAELLLMDPDQHAPETKECLKQVVAASERAANLTRQLLAFSRKQVMQSRPLVLNDVIADLTKMLRRIIGEHIDLQCRYGAQLPCVQADPGMIEQVLVNLTVNARDAMPHGGQLLITTETVSLDVAYAQAHPEAHAGEFVCLAVADAGTGIAPEHLPRIFEPFFTTKELGKGTGLGLATVYGIVKQHQGWIEVSSQLGAGATFKIFLPAIPTPARTAATPQAEADLPGGTETILLVEDDYAVRVITRRVLESHGYKVYEATSAPEALELWRSRAEEIALLLTDIVMPQGVTGRDLAEKLRAERPALKVILMSGYSADVVGRDTDFFRRSKTSFLQKPCSSRTLLETVRHCLDGK